MTLKKIFITSIILLSVILLLFQEYIFTTTNKVIDLQQNEVIAYTTEKIEDSILSKLKTLKHLRSYVNRDMYDYLIDICENNSNKQPSAFFSEKLEKPNQLLSDSVFYMAFSNDTTYKFSHNITETEAEQIRNCYRNFRQSRENNILYDYDFFVLDNAGYNDLYICIMSDIYKTTYDIIGRKYIATYVICSKLNLNELTLLEQRFENLDLKLVSSDQAFNLLCTDKNSKIVQSINYKIPDTRYSLQGVLHQDNTINTTYKISKIIILETVFLILLLIVMIILSEVYITLPISKIVHHIEKVSILSVPTPLKLKTISEFNTIATYINSMVTNNRDLAQRIVNTQQQLYELEIEKYKSDLVSLEHQINPHFLYNTLECVRSIAVINDIKEIEEIVTYLSEIMRYSVKANNIVPLSNELSVISMYFKIMAIRFPKLKDIQIIASDETAKILVPKMILQPIAENIFKHGISASNNIAIKITSEMDGEDLLISITDSGRGISSEKLEKLQELLLNNTDIKQENIGLLNVDRRIKLHFGSDYGIRINSEEGVYTTILMRIGKFRNNQNKQY